MHVLFPSDGARLVCTGRTTAQHAEATRGGIAAPAEHADGLRRLGMHGAEIGEEVTQGPPWCGSLRRRVEKTDSLLQKLFIVELMDRGGMCGTRTDCWGTPVKNVENSLTGPVSTVLFLPGRTRK